MRRRLSVIVSVAAVLLGGLAVAPAESKPEGTLTVAVATFGNERWLPHLYVGAEDIVLKPLWENLLNRDAKGTLIPMLAERWEVLDGGRTWRFHLRKGVRFHDGSELTADDVKFTFASIAREGSANALAGEFRLIKSMEVENPHTISVRFEKPFVTFGNRVTHGLFSSTAYIQSKKYVETAGEDGAERRPIGTGPWKFVEQVLGGLGAAVGTVNYYPTDPWATKALLEPLPFDPAKAKALLGEAGYPNGFEVTMNLTAWPGRGFLPDVGEAVATYWERIGLKVKRRPVDRAVFASDFRARSYPGVALAYAGPIIAPEPWELFARIAQTKSAVHLLVEP